MASLRGRRGASDAKVVSLIQQFLASLDLVDAEDVGDLIDAALAGQSGGAQKYGGALNASATDGTADQVSTLVLPAGALAIGSILRISAVGWATEDPEFIVPTATITVTANGVTLFTGFASEAPYRSVVMWTGEVTAANYVDPVDVKGFAFAEAGILSGDPETTDFTNQPITFVVTVSGGVSGSRGVQRPIVIVTPPAPTS